MFIMGIIENKFNSNPIHIENQFDEEIVIKVLKIINIKKVIFVKFKFIRKKNIISIVEVWIQKLNLAYFSFYISYNIIFSCLCI